MMKDGLSLPSIGARISLAQLLPLSHAVLFSSPPEGRAGLLTTPRISSPTDTTFFFVPCKMTPFLIHLFRSTAIKKGPNYFFFSLPSILLLLHSSLTTHLDTLHPTSSFHLSYKKIANHVPRGKRPKEPRHGEYFQTAMLLFRFLCIRLLCFS
ncbi:MAG: hypothetical protein JOS17DRAFT_756044 [Linnemannia elongata]|nr:MAG: hypothetical protein JOS17DRAFT_756044 [Linnemannia elongata]